MRLRLPPRDGEYPLKLKGDIDPTELLRLRLPGLNALEVTEPGVCSVSIVPMEDAGENARELTEPGGESALKVPIELSDGDDFE